MGQKRKNKSAWKGSRKQNQDWFVGNKKRQRARAKQARKARRKNRGKN